MVQEGRQYLPEIPQSVLALGLTLACETPTAAPLRRSGSPIVETLALARAQPFAFLSPVSSSFAIARCDPAPTASSARAHAPDTKSLALIEIRSLASGFLPRGSWPQTGH